MFGIHLSITLVKGEKNLFGKFHQTNLAVTAWSQSIGPFDFCHVNRVQPLCEFTVKKVLIRILDCVEQTFIWSSFMRQLIPDEVVGMFYWNNQDFGDNEGSSISNEDFQAFLL